MAGYRPTVRPTPRSNPSLGTDTQQQKAATRRMLRAGQLERYVLRELP